MMAGSSPRAGIDPTPPWRLTGIGVLRILFGCVWAIDAWFKWQPGFHNDFMSYLTGAQHADGQPEWVKSWIGFWINTVNVDPHGFAIFVACAETALAVALVLGVFSNVTYIAGALMSLVIWTTAESFGGPYAAGSTDIGAAVMYAIVFVALFLSRAGLYAGLDRVLTPRLGRWGWLASGPSR